MNEDNSWKSALALWKNLSNDISCREGSVRSACICPQSPVHLYSSADQFLSSRFPFLPSVAAASLGGVVLYLIGYDRSG